MAHNGHFSSEDSHDNTKTYRIVVLPGDGIGPEIVEPP